ncbi:hypothetical protein PSHT_06826 [Puccinia striiformis]|uniref:Uncharacterized protein n=1 Tax=Puccinia striiformis TaxID=27350 RepID=A0A2S4W370_9BASI|nr:hypothetical protein PSHT_06826 [Puccinia striiformis]
MSGQALIHKAGNRKPSVEIAANAHWLRTWCVISQEAKSLEPTRTEPTNSTTSQRFSEERLPVELGWKKPSSKITLFGTLRLMKEMKALQDG